MPLIVKNVIEIANTAVEMMLMFLYFSLLSKPKCGKLYFVIAYVIATVLLSVTVLKSGSTIINFAVTVVIITLTAFLCYDDTNKRRLFWIAIYLLIISIADPLMIGILCVANLGTPVDFLQAGAGRYLGMIGTNLIYLWLIGMVHRIVKKKMRELPVKYWVLIIAIPIISIFLLQMMIDNMAMQGDSIHYFSVGIALAGIIYINVAMFSFFESYDDKIRLKYLETLKQQEDENYKLLALSHKQVKEMKHDIENQFSVLNDMLENGDTDGAKAYLVKLGSFVRLANRMCYTGNNAVDSIVNIKGSIARNYGIEFICKVNIITSIKADEMELCRIIGNGLDNAIEGCERSGADSKHICFSISEDKDKLIITITNTSDKVDITALNSTKKDKGLHGIGISSIKSSVERLGGLVKFDYSDGIFKLSIMVQNRSTSD